jgi:hypothetical protein
MKATRILPTLFLLTLFCVTLTTSAHPQLECRNYCSCSASGGILLADVTSTGGWQVHPLSGGGISGSFEFRADCTETDIARGRVYGCFTGGTPEVLRVCLTWTDPGSRPVDSAHWRNVRVEGYTRLTSVGGVDQTGCQSILEASCHEAWGLVGFCNCRGVTQIDFIRSPYDCPLQAPLAESSGCENLLNSNDQLVRNFFTQRPTPIPKAFAVRFTYQFLSGAGVTSVRQQLRNFYNPEDVTSHSFTEVDPGYFTATITKERPIDGCGWWSIVVSVIELLSVRYGGFDVGIRQFADALCSGALTDPDELRWSAGSIEVETPDGSCAFDPLPGCSLFPPYSQTLAASIEDCLSDSDCRRALWLGQVYLGSLAASRSPLNAETIPLMMIESTSGDRYGRFHGADYSELETVRIDQQGAPVFAAVVEVGSRIWITNNGVAGPIVLEVGGYTSTGGSPFVTALRYDVSSFGPTAVGRVILGVEALPSLELDDDGDGVFETRIAPNEGPIPVRRTTWSSIKTRAR